MGLRFAQYVKELQRIKPLAREEEAQLWQAYKAGGEEDARRQLIEAYQPLVFKQALPYRSLQNIMDVVQEGTVGLIEAVERYDPERGIAFSLFAIHRIRCWTFCKRKGLRTVPVWMLRRMRAVPPIRKI